MARYKINKRQYRNDQCVVCGFNNPFSLGMEFFELENGEVAAYANTQDWHQSYPGRTHGGIISAMLDEVIGRAICTAEPQCWGVTTGLSVKFKKPVPLGPKLLVVGRVTRNRSRMFTGTGEIYLIESDAVESDANGDACGELLASAEGTYLKLKAEQIIDCPDGEDPITRLNWQLRPQPADMPEYIDLPY